MGITKEVLPEKDSLAMALRLVAERVAVNGIQVSKTASVAHLIGMLEVQKSAMIAALSSNDVSALEEQTLEVATHAVRLIAALKIKAK